MFMFWTKFVPITVITTTFWDGRVTIETGEEIVIDVSVLTEDSKPVMKPLEGENFT